MINELLEKAQETLKQRGRDNGYDKNAGTAQEERSAVHIARVYNAITGQNISEADAWTFLQCLKLVRMENQIKTGSGDLLDTAIDLISYSALKSEAVLQQHRPAQVAELLGRAKPKDVDNATLKGCAARFDDTLDAARLPPFLEVRYRPVHPVCGPTANRKQELDQLNGVFKHENNGD